MGNNQPPTLKLWVTRDDFWKHLEEGSGCQVGSTARSLGADTFKVVLFPFFLFEYSFFLSPVHCFVTPLRTFMESLLSGRHTAGQLQLSASLLLQLLPKEGQSPNSGCKPLQHSPFFMSLSNSSSKIQTSLFPSGTYTKTCF